MTASTARTNRWTLGASCAVVFAIATLVIGATPAEAGPVGLGSATSYAVLAGSTVTDAGVSVIAGDVGLSPGPSVGLLPAQVAGEIHVDDAQAQQAKTDLVLAYDDAAGRTPATQVVTELGGKTFTPGTYTNTTLGLTGTVTLDAQNDPAAVFVFKTTSTLITAPDSAVLLTGQANPCNVYWQVGDSATLDLRTSFVGTVMALNSITVNDHATVQGRVLARNGAVTLDDNVITRPSCTTLPAGSTTTTASTTTAPTTTVAGPTTTISGPTTTVAGPTTTTGAPATTTTVVVPSTLVESTTTAPTTSSSTTPSLATTPPGSDQFRSGPPAPGGPGGGTSSMPPPRTTTTGLARTGSETSRQVAIGLLSVTLGGLLVTMSRRRARPA